MPLPLSRAELQTRQATGEQFEFFPFYGHTPPAHGVDASCLSQWFVRPFTVDGVTWKTAEHWMMGAKATLFEPAALEAIIAASTPRDAKALGRAVKHFDEHIWAQQRVELVTQGNVHKFGQHDDLRAFLLSTGDTVLVEAAPRDQLWGIGLGVNNPLVRTAQRWRGLNLLGFSLMRAREVLRARAV